MTGKCTEFCFKKKFTALLLSRVNEHIHFCCVKLKQALYPSLAREVEVITKLLDSLKII